MKRFLCASLLLCVVFSSGCSYFVPGAIKRETSLMNLNIKTALKEIEAIENSEKPEAQKDKEVKEKAVRALKRAAPHTDNLYKYTHGLPSK
jgi:hypothetical protein